MFQYEHNKVNIDSIQLDPVKYQKIKYRQTTSNIHKPRNNYMHSAERAQLWFVSTSDLISTIYMYANILNLLECNFAAFCPYIIHTNCH